VIRWRDPRVRILAVALFAAYAWFFQGGGWNQNTRLALTRAVVEQQSLRIDATARVGGRLVTGDYAERDGHYYSDKAPGSSLAAVPAVALASYLTASPPTAGEVTFLGYVATLATSAVPTVLSALLLAACAEALGASATGALVALGAFALGSPAWAYATLLWGTALSTFSLLGAFAAGLALRRRDDDDDGRDARLGLLVGLGGGWATITEYPAAVPAAIIAVMTLAGVWDDPQRRRRVALGIAAGAAVTAALLAAYNSAAFGSALTLGYSRIRGFAGMQQGLFGVTRPRGDVLIEILVGSYRGLGRLAPVLFLGPLGLWGLTRGAARGPAIAALAVAGYYVLLNASYAYWDGGWSYGPRHLAPALPFLALGLAPLWDRATRDQRRVILALALWGAALAFVAVSTTAQPPESARAPVSALLWPAFARGELSLNHQSLLQPETTSPRDAVNHAWNLGERLGLSGHLSLMPLLLLWALLHRAWTQPSAPPAPVARPSPTPVSAPRAEAPRRPTAPPVEVSTGDLLRRAEAWLTPGRSDRVALALLAFWAALAVHSARGDAPTVDEFVYPPEGAYYLRTGDFLFNPQNPPLIKLLGGAVMLLHGARLDLAAQWRTNFNGWEPWVFSTRFMLDNRREYHALFVEARMLNIALGALLGWFVYRWARALWGTVGGVVSAAAFVACPTILAHARLLTPDLAVTLFMFLASYALWRWSEAPSRGRALIVGACVGLSFASKFSAVLLAPILVAQLWATRGALRARVIPLGRKEIGAHVGLALLAAVVILDACFGFRGMFHRLGDLRFASGSFRGLASLAPWLRLPLPDALLLGIDAKTADAARGEFSAGFLFGAWSTTGWRSFYLVSFLTKTPIGLLGLAAVALSQWRDREDDKPAALTLVIPAVAFITLSTVFFYKVNYGVRYLLPLFPALYVLCGRAAVLALRSTWVAPTSVAMLAWAALSSWSTHPSYLAYVNESLGGPELAYQSFVDSNVDWGQDLRRLAEWARANRVERVHLSYFGHVDPGIYGLSYVPLRVGQRPEGVIAVSVSQLQGLAYPSTYENVGNVVGVGRDDFAWLRSRRPTAVIGHSIFVWDLRSGR
jgi:4-amino-4-deoxy-L-arabinose transferase-like glycosyltransferase